MITTAHLKQQVKEFVRPAIITILAAVAFTALLGFHHAKFEDSMVRAFQKQQLDATRSWADAVEKQAVGIRHDLSFLASHPDVCRLAPAMKDILAAYLTQENAVLDNLEVFDVGGARLWSGRPAGREELRNEAGPMSSSTMPGKRNHLFRMRLPIELDGQPVGTLQADVNVFGVALRCQPKADSAGKSLCLLLAGSGEVIYGNDIFSKPRQVIHALRDSDAPKEAVHNAQLLPYVVERCISGNSSGLAETIRPEGHVVELLAFAPINVEGRRFGLVMGSPRGDVSVPIASHERVTYALIAALALLYFVTGYTALRGERSHTQHEEQRRQAAEEASKAKGNYLAKMSHELRTPMNGIISMTELATGAENAVERRKYLGVVKECADSLLSVINDILDLSKIEAGRLKLSHEPFSVATCVANTLTSLAPLAREKGLALRWEIDLGIPAVVFGDPGRLRQILNNLIGNAIKFTRRGEVVVRVTPQTVRLNLAVLQFDASDTGPGMSPNDLERIFNPYYQCSDAEVYRKNSTGLGLPIARQLVELMGGRISVASAVGKGTVFTFTAKFDSAASEASDAGGTSLPSLEHVRALVISSVPANLRRFSGLLGGWGAQVDCAADATDGLPAMSAAQDQGTPFGLILFENNETAMDAFAFAEALATLQGCEKAALAVICPNGLRGDALRCPPTGIDAYLGIRDLDDRLRLALRLALQHAEHRNGGAPITKHSSPEVAGLQILLVEDNPVNQQGASLLLSQWGHKVDIAGSGEEAVAVLAGREFDLVLMDLELPGISGIEATAQIRAREKERGKHTHIMGMTGHAMDSDRAGCLAAGMDGYISKPFRPDQLRRAVENVAVGVSGGTVGYAPPARAPAACPQEPVWDAAEALRLADGNRMAVGIIIQTFLKDLRATLPAAQSAALARDEKRLAKAAHRWKGALGLLGARRAFSCAVRLEEVCRLGEPERLLESFQRLHHELLVLEKALCLAEQESVSCRSS